MSIVFFSFFDWHFSCSITHEFNSTPVSKRSSSMAESSRRFTIGCALANKKQRSLIQPSLVNLAKERGIDLIKIDNETPLIEQPQFDLIQIFGRTPDLIFRTPDLLLRTPDLIHNPKIEVHGVVLLFSHFHIQPIVTVVFTSSLTSKVSAMQALMASVFFSISGQIPACLTSFSQLRVIDLIDFKKLQNLASSRSSNGWIPSDFGQMEKLSRSLLSSNRLIASIPNSTGEIKRLADLDLSTNQISDSFSNQSHGAKKLEMGARAHDSSGLDSMKLRSLKSSLLTLSLPHPSPAIGHQQGRRIRPSLGGRPPPRDSLKLQEKYPVFFLTNAGNELYYDVRRNSLEEALKVCLEGGLDGIVSEVKGIFKNPGTVSKIKDSNLSLLTYGQLNNVPEAVYMQHLMGVDGVIVDLVREITEAVTSYNVTKPVAETEGMSEEKLRFNERSWHFC